jgi:hypothetical protein
MVIRMDAFEQIVGEILWKEGFWVHPSFKVELTKAEKKKIGRHSAPRWELDIVAYKAKENSLYVVECKSYLDSQGVAAAGFDGSNKKAADRYKLFNESTLRRIVVHRLCKQLTESGACRKNPSVKLALACGKIKSDIDRIKLHAHFKKKKWELWDEEWLKDRIRNMANQSYENQIASVVAKLILREHKNDYLSPMKDE